MGDIRSSRDAFLWGMCAVYLFAFTSLYHQIPGLYGNNGILPVRVLVPLLDSDPMTVKTKMRETPSLLWIAPYLELDVDQMMELLALLGMLMSFCGLIWTYFRGCTSFALMWILYYSMYQVGQTFMWFQWDILLLEAGFLTILVAPLRFIHRRHSQESWGLSIPLHPHDSITFWLIRWLLFRLMFASGVVKLTSMCPTWWGLKALEIHFESQCIPTPLAWYAHYLPKSLLHLGVVGTYVIEIAVPFLFFVPVRSIKVFSFICQVFFQAMIILTGNYNFFNILTVVLCFSILSDETTDKLSGPSIKSSSMPFRWTKWMLEMFVKIFIYVGLIYWTVILFSLQFHSDGSLSSKIAFTSPEFNQFLKYSVPFSIILGALSLGGNILLSLYRSLIQVPGVFSKVWSVMGTVIFSGAAIWLFIISLVPHTVVHTGTHEDLWPVIKEWHAKTDQLQVTSAYGLFRRMTGVNGRPEVIIEGSNSLNSGWKEYHFLYKPGALSDRPPFIIPHQPRLDWQMWFAALSPYNHHPWFVSFMYRLLTGQPEVIDLIDKSRNPFPKEPPKYIRATLYTYRYAPFNSAQRKSPHHWWTRMKQSEYFPVVSKDHQPLLNYLKSANIPVVRKPNAPTNSILASLLRFVRQLSSTVEAPLFIWSIFLTAIVGNFITSLFSI